MNGIEHVRQKGKSTSHINKWLYVKRIGCYLGVHQQESRRHTTVPKYENRIKMDMSHD